MKWPTWGRTEHRESSYTDLLVGLAVSRASGTAGAPLGATGALQACVGMVSRAFAAATVQGSAHLAAGVTPAVLSTIGRALMRAGEVVYLIDVGLEGAVRLRPVGQWDVFGDVPEESWTYRVTMNGPTMTRTRQVPAAGLIHCRYEIDPDRPWRGVGPLQSASLAGRLSAETTAALADSESGPRGALLPLPVAGDDPTVGPLKADLRTLAGKLAFVESVRSMHAGAAGNAPGGDWETKRIGADPPRGEVDLFTRSGIEVVNAMGCAGLFDATTANAAREAFRRFLHATVMPIGRIVSHELSTKLEGEVTLDFTAIGAADVQGRARAWRSLAGPEASMTAEVAARLVGLAVDE